MKYYMHVDYHLIIFGFHPVTHVYQDVIKMALSINLPPPQFFFFGGGGLLDSYFGSDKVQFKLDI